METSDPQGFGKSFVLTLIGGLVLVVLVYAVAHLVVGNPKVTWRDFASIANSGEVTFTHLDDMDWYIGADRAEATLKAIRDRNAAIVEAHTRLRADLRRIGDGIANSGAIATIEAFVRDGRYADAFTALDRLVAGLSVESQRQLSTAGLGDRIFDLQRLVRSQLASLEDLAPPSAQLFFWTAPNKAVFEVLFWAFFGVITNLLVNAAEYLRQGNFIPRERFVAYTKLVYGPILATVMVLAIIFGWFDLGAYSTRVWTLPLVAFLFGYAARRTATLFDKLQDKVFGAADKSIDEGPVRILEARSRALDRLREAVRPLTLTELRDQAKQLTREQIGIASAVAETKP